MFYLLAMMACNISGKWRDYSYNDFQIPAEYCETENNCWLIEKFTMELSKDFVGDFRVQIGLDEDHYIYTLPISAERSGGQWLFSVDNSDYNKMPEEWTCDKTGGFLICDINDDKYQFRRGGFR